MGVGVPNDAQEHGAARGFCRGTWQHQAAAAATAATTAVAVAAAAPPPERPDVFFGTKGAYPAALMHHSTKAAWSESLRTSSQRPL